MDDMAMFNHDIRDVQPA